jgi:hypothetical protein
LHKKTSTPVKLLKIEGNGQTNTEDTTQLTLTTDVSILDLKNGDIKLINKTQTDKMITADEMLG